MQLDAWFSMVVFTVATVAFYLLGAAVLHPQGLDPKGSEMIPTLSQMYLQPLEGTALAGFRGLTRVGFLLGAWAVLFKTLYVATAANSRLTADFLNLVGIWQPAGPTARERMVRVFCVIYPVLALGLYYAFREPQGADQGRRHRPGADAPPDRRRDALPAAAATPTAASARRSSPTSSPGSPSSPSRPWPRTASTGSSRTSRPGSSGHGMTWRRLVSDAAGRPARGADAYNGIPGCAAKSTAGR